MRKMVKFQGPILEWLRRRRAASTTVPGEGSRASRRLDLHTVLDRIALIGAIRIKHLLRLDAERKVTRLIRRRNRIAGRLRTIAARHARAKGGAAQADSDLGAFRERLVGAGVGPELLAKKNNRFFTQLVPVALFLGGWVVASLAFEFLSNGKPSQLDQLFAGLDKSVVAGFVVELALACLAKVAGMCFGWAGVPMIPRSDGPEGDSAERPLVSDDVRRWVYGIAGAVAIAIGIGALWAVAKLRAASLGIQQAGGEAAASGAISLGGGGSGDEVGVFTFALLMSASFVLQVVIATVVATPAATAQGRLKKAARAQDRRYAWVDRRFNRLWARYYTLGRKINEHRSRAAGLQEVAELEKRELIELYAYANPDLYGVISEAAELESALRVPPPGEGLSYDEELPPLDVDERSPDFPPEEE